MTIITQVRQKKKKYPLINSEQIDTRQSKLYLKLTLLQPSVHSTKQAHLSCNLPSSSSWVCNLC